MKNTLTLSWKLIICLVFLMVKTSLGQPQKIDSLEKWLEKHPKQDTNFIKTLIALNTEYMYGNSDKFEASAQQLLNVSQANKNQDGICQGLFFLANVEEKKGNHAKALTLAQQAADVSEKHEFYLYHANALSFISRIYGIMKHEKKHIEYILKEYEYSSKIPADKLNPKEYLVNRIVSSSNVSLAYISLKQPKEAVKYALVADKTCEEYYLKFKEPYRLWHGALYNVAFAYFRLKNYAKAEEYMKKAYQKMSLIKSEWRISQFDQMMGNIYLEQNRFIEAKEVLSKGIAYAKKEASIDDLYRLSNTLRQVYAKQQDFKSAYEELSMTKKYSDSLYQKDQTKVISEMTTKYETEKKNQQIKLLEANNKIAETQKKQYVNLTIGLASILLLSLFSLYYIHKAKQKTDAANHQRDKLFSIVAHDLRSPVASLQHITSTISHVFKKKDPQATQLLSDTIEDAASTLYKLVDNLLQWSLLQRNSTLLRPTNFLIQHEIEEVLSTLHSRAASKNIDLKLMESPPAQVKADRMSVQTIVRNLVDNALKFTPKNGNITIEVQALENCLQLRISDNGIGIPPSIQEAMFEDNAPQKSRLGTDGEKGTGVGLFVCRELALLNGGDLRLHKSDRQGSTFLLELPQTQ